MTTVDRSLMRGFEPHDPWFVAGLPLSSVEHGMLIPQDSDLEGSPNLWLLASRHVRRRILAFW